MPWNDKSNPGPWGSPPSGGGGNDDRGRKDNGGGSGEGSPWSRPSRPSEPREPRRRLGGPNGPETPDLDALTRQLRDRARRFFRGPGGRQIRPQSVAAVAAVVGGLWLLTGVYVVQPNEEAVVTRFGAYAGTALPGLQYHLPWPIETVEKVQVTAVRRTDIGGPATAGSDAPGESLMLTGDENIVDLDFTVQWRVSNAARYLFTLDDPEQSVRAVAESAMREVVGRTALQPILSSGRGEVQNQTAALMQRVMDAYGSGVEVVEVQIRNANPPDEVVPAFRAVASANQEAESRINEASAYRNRVVAEARGQASAIRAQSEAYREQAIRQAEGDAARFSEVYEQYRQAPDVTRRRLYLETMERAVRNSRTIVAEGGTQAPIILPQAAVGAQPQVTVGQAQVEAAQSGAPASAQGAAR